MVLKRFPICPLHSIQESILSCYVAVFGRGFRYVPKHVSAVNQENKIVVGVGTKLFRTEPFAKDV